jgi:hypothetical protein
MIRPLKLLTLSSIIAAASATHAAAFCVPPCVAPAPAPVAVAPAPIVVVQPAAPYYVVNQGPVYAGPGIVTYPGYFNEVAVPTFYPYVSVDYYLPYPHYYGPRVRPAWHGRHPYRW